MKVVTLLVTVLLGILSLAAGGAKVALVPQEVEFLGQFGLTSPVIVGFGVVQALGGLLMLVPVTRFYGSLITAAGFAVSAILVLLAGNMAFAGVSLVPVVLAGFIAHRSYPAAPGVEAG